MQTKTIKKIIKNKMEEWLASITDIQLRKDVEHSLMVSGGSIASLFFNEKVNDYDVYLQDMNILIRLAKYYVKDHTVMDGRLKEQYIKEFEDEAGFSVKGWEEANNEKYVAQRYVRLANLKPDQVKLDIKSGGIPFTFEEGHTPHYEVAFISQNAISLTNDVQIVLRFSGTPEQIHKNYDFIHATNYYTTAKGLVTNVDALESLLTKTLKYQGSLYPLTSIIRMKKFIKRNWGISAGEILKIMFQISELDLKDVRVLEDQLIGVDVAYFSTLLEILKDVKRKEITSEYINTVIDRVFDEYEGEDDGIKTQEK